MSRQILRSAGSSASGTPGTTCADIQAGASKILTEWFVVAEQTSATSTQVRITITYTDASSTTFDSAASTAVQLYGNAGGGIRMAGGIPNLNTAFSAKDVNRIQVTTLGTGTGTRYGIASATEV